MAVGGAAVCGGRAARRRCPRRSRAPIVLKLIGPNCRESSCAVGRSRNRRAWRCNRIESNLSRDQLLLACQKCLGAEIAEGTAD